MKALYPGSRRSLGKNQTFFKFSKSQAHKDVVRNVQAFSVHAFRGCTETLCTNSWSLFTFQYSTNHPIFGLLVRMLWVFRRFVSNTKNQVTKHVYDFNVPF